jgi:hypothetical protein
MQFKRQGRRIQVLAYRGYDRAKRRAIVKMLGSLDAYSYEPSDGLLENLTGEEKIELQSYIEKERQAVEKRTRQYSAMSIASRINEVADTIRAGDFVPAEAWATEAWAALDALIKALRRSGHPRPKRKRPAPVALPGQADLLDVPETES